MASSLLTGQLEWIFVVEELALAERSIHQKDSTLSSYSSMFQPKEICLVEKAVFHDSEPHLANAHPRTPSFMIH
ncbi:hypothetical protein LINPERPRIM_LOCUS25442, partial [Linum perenne]